MKKRHLSAVALSLAVMLLATPRCFAQVRGTVELSPVVGIYLPNGQLPPEPSAFRCTPGVPCNFDPTPRLREQHSAVALGSRVTAWVHKGIALEGSLWYSPSSVTGSSTGATGSVVASDVRVLVGTRGAANWAYLVGGPAFVARLGDAYTNTSGTARLGGILGVGAHLRVARSVALRAEVVDCLYSLQGYHQQDFFLSVGLSVASRIGGAATP